MKLVEPPTQFVAAAGVITQLGLGTQVWVAVQGGLTQPLASVILAVKVHVPGVVHEIGRASCRERVYHPV